MRALCLRSIIPFSIAVSVGGVSSAFPQNGEIVLEEAVRIGKKDDFIRIEEVSASRRGKIVVSDAYRYVVKQFSAGGLFEREFGKRGSGDEEFTASPFKFVQREDMTGIIEKGSSRVRFYDSQFRLIRSIPAPGVIIDAVCDMRGRLYLNLFPFNRRADELLVCIEIDGTGVTNMPLGEVAEEPVFNMVHVGVNSQDELVVAHRFLNLITLYSREGAIRDMFNVEGWPARSPVLPSTVSGEERLPTGDVIADIAVDARTDYIFILAGAYAPDPYRSVYVYDRGGKRYCAMRLPDKSGILYVDGAGYMYTREKERTVLRRYTIVYRKGKN